MSPHDDDDEPMVELAVPGGEIAGGLGRQQHHHLENINEIVEELERWQMADMLADVVRIQEDVVEEVEEEEEEDVDWVSPLTREYTKSFTMSADCCYHPQQQHQVASEFTLFGTDWFGDDRESLNDLAKYFNNAHLSDVNLVVGEEIFPAHRLILAKSSEVFDRMLSQRWNGEKNELELVEEPMCQKAFSSFLRFLYCNHVVLNQDNCLPLLVLSDKYNVTTLKKVCLDFAQSQIIPVIDTKELFSVWFSYATKAYHPSLIRTCMQAIALDFDTLLSEDWEKNWQALDRDQMIEILKCNNLRLPSEYKLWEAFLKWIQAPNHPERRGNTSSPLLTLVLPLIRFPYMTPDELSLVEKSSIAEMHPKLFLPPVMLAYKFQALPISSRINCKEFLGKQFLLRNYDDIRWYKRLTINKLLLTVDSVDHSLIFLTRSSTYPSSEWKWTLKLAASTYDSSMHSDTLRILLIADEIDQPRAVEYLLQIADERKIIRSYFGKKTFTKTRYSTEFEVEKKFEFGEMLNDDTSLLSNGDVTFHVLIKPIE